MAEFHFKGGVTNSPSGGTCKFLLFLLNGDKEISLSQAVKYGLAEHKPAESLDKWSPNLFSTAIPIVKVLLYEDGGFGKQKLSQQFWLAVGKRLEKQIVTITPRTAQAALGYQFQAEATFLKRSEVLQLIPQDSLSAKVLRAQQTPPASVLREIIKIERIGLPPDVKVASHGGVRKLRIRQEAQA